MPSMQSTLILTTTLLGSFLQSAAAAPEATSALTRRAEVQFPDCISTCMRNSGCFDSACVCKKASSGDGILSDIVICMNQWCPATVTAKDLIEPLQDQGGCSLPKPAVQDAEKKGGIVVADTGSSSGSSDSGSGNSGDETSSAKPAPTATPAPGGKSGGSHGDDGNDVSMTYDVGSPVTAAAEPTTTTVKHPAGATGTLTVPTDAATTGGLLTDGADGTPTSGSLVAPSSTGASPSSSSAAAGSSSNDDDDNNAGVASQASIFGVVAAMAVALAMGF
ncbi:hypothetical protein F4777DRAFT_249746 [Nemania sp. FL0916]|nr:hypothetical protein F4777DRAFT_249746 [Nemania sp. FL0916]